MERMLAGKAQRWEESEKEEDTTPAIFPSIPVFSYKSTGASSRLYQATAYWLVY